MKLNILIVIIFKFSFYSVSQLTFKKVTNHRIKYSFINDSISKYYFFETNCFYYYFFENDKKKKVIVERQRASLKNDTLYIYLHDINFHDYRNTRDPNYEYCKESNKWRYNLLTAEESSKEHIILIKKKIKYKVLCIYYSDYIDSIKNRCYHRVFYNKKLKQINYEYNIPPLRYQVLSDSIFNKEGTDRGVGYRWYPKASARKRS